MIEVKYPDDGNLDAGCQEALKQIEDRRYADRTRLDGMTRIIKMGRPGYGISPKKSRKIFGFYRAGSKNECIKYQVDFDEIKKWYNGYRVVIQRDIVFIY